jgi:hypothetical protein
MSESEGVFVHEVWDVVEVDGVPIRRVRQYVDGELVAEHVLAPQGGDNECR